MSAFQKGLIAGVGIFLLLALVVGAGVGVWWLNSSSQSNAATSANSPVVSANATPLAQANPNTTNPNSANPNSNNANPTPQANTNPPVRGTPPAGNALARIAGSFGLVREVNDDSIVVIDRQETETILIGANTRLIISGKANATLDDVATGDKVLALGGMKGNQTDARLVLVVPAAYTNANILTGQITNVKGTTLTIKTPQGDKTVTTNSGTQMLSQQLDSNTSATFTTGATVLVVGQPGVNGLTAEVILGQGRAPAGNQPVRPGPSPTPTK